MSSTEPALGAFPSPYSVQTPPGCEGWEEMYPYYALFDERRRETDENRFWFWNSMHFPVPHAGLRRDLHRLALSGGRLLAEPGVRGAAGDGHRLPGGQRLHLHLRQPGHRPGEDRRAGRATSRGAPATTTRTGPSSTASGSAKMEALIAELGRAARCPSLPEYEPDEVAFGDDRNTAFYEVLDAYGRCLRLGDLMWQHHFEFLLLGYGAYATFAELCKAHLPDIPDQHIAQMVAGIDVLLFRPTPSCAGWPGWRSRPASTARSSRGARPQEIDAELARSEAGRSWLARARRRSRTRGSTWRPATVSPTTTAAGSTTRASRTRRSIGHIAALRAGAADRAPDGGDRARSATGWPQEYGALLAEETRGPWSDLLALSRTVFPYVEEHKFFCDYWFLTRWWNKMREFGALLAEQRLPRGRRGHLPAVAPRGRLGAGRADADLGDRRGSRSAPSTGRRSWRGASSCWTRLAEWTPPPALGVAPETITDPMTIMLWGVTTDRVREWARQQEGGSRAATAPPPRPARSRARRASCARSRRSPTCATGEILVCGSTSPAWAPIFTKIRATVTDVGGRHVPRRDRVPRVRAAGRRRHRPGHLADPHRPDDPRRRDGGRGDPARRGR